MLTILQAERPEHIALARELIMEYAAWLEFKLCFQGFEEEMRSLPGSYAPPTGRLLIAFWEGKPAGVIALRSLAEEGICEMKRLYVRSEFRGHHIGQAMAERVIGEASEIGYSRMRLDTVPGQMDRAIAMYRELGFAETQPYYQTPVGQTVFMELVLPPSKKGASRQQKTGQDSPSHQ
jgi:GNAT superfamily N-acetyltransferase